MKYGGICTISLHEWCCCCNLVAFKGNLGASHARRFEYLWGDKILVLSIYFDWMFHVDEINHPVVPTAVLMKMGRNDRNRS